jgi:transglutaminase-like putative cysteine protease
MSVRTLNLTVRIGCTVEYYASAYTPIVFVVRPGVDRNHLVNEEKHAFGPGPIMQEFEDSHGNITYRAMLAPGSNRIHHDALVSVSSLPDSRETPGGAVPVDELPADVLRYTLPSRYCDSDKLRDFAWDHFGQVKNGLDRVQAICDWVHQKVEYRYGSGRPDLSASEIIQRRYGVCRDFAHSGIALCRAFNLPARYVTGHLPDIAFIDSGSPMDFHAYMEVFLEGGWHTFDPRFNVPRIGRVKVAHGQDAVDGAFSTIYGAADLVNFQVWAYQVDPREVAIGSPIDISKRLDGTLQLNLP